MNEMRDFHDLASNKKNKTIYCWVFNIGIEHEWITDYFQVKDLEEELVVRHMEEIMLFMADEQDILILRKMPDVKFLKNMKEIGFSIPHILCPEKEGTLDNTITELVLQDEKLIRKLGKYAKKNLIYLVPYGVTKKEEDLARICGMKLKGSSATVTKKVNSKLYARELVRELCFQCPKGFVCDCLEDVLEAYNKLSQSFCKIVIKRPYGASGKGLYLVDSPQKMRNVLHILKRSCIEHERWIVEGWYEDKIDLNVQLYLHDNGKIDVFSIKEQLLDETVYKGSFFPFVFEESRMQKYLAQIRKAGKNLYLNGVRGVVGIDSVLTQNEIFPIIEINARFTLSTYLSILPFKFKDRCFLSMYYKVLMNDNDVYSKLEQEIKASRLVFDPVQNMGIIFYNPACLDKSIVKRTGRLFLVIVEENLTKLNEMKTKFEEILEEVTGTYGIGESNS